MPMPASTAPRIHGGLLDEELQALGIDPAQVLDFSVSTNPYGPCPAVVDAVRSTPIDRYPDPTARTVRAVMASQLGIHPDQVALGNGAADLLWTLARTLIRPGSTAVIVEPTFCEFRAAVHAAGGYAVQWRAREADRFAVDLAAIGQLARDEKADVLYLCAPNTPTGIPIPASEVTVLALAHRQVTVVLDQSFLPLSEQFADATVRFPDNVVCVRSLTKEHAIPGVRVGYLISTPRVAAQVEAYRPAWTTSAMAQAAALVACRQTGFVEESRRKLLADRERLAAMLRNLDLDPLPSATPFFLVRVRDGGKLRQRLLQRHQILVRDCTSFGLADFIRLSARPEPDCERLLAALKEELPSC
ncbi:MAG: histidinol-phosphate transaminase [Pseudomonadota bacterium]